MYESFLPRDMFAEIDRLQRELQRAFDISPSIRGIGRGGYPAINAGATANSVEIFVFTPGMDPNSLEVNLDRGVLTVAGERNVALPRQDQKTTVHINERFSGRFRRVVSMPDDIDPNAVTAQFRNGVVHISAKRQASAQPRRINVQ